MPTATVRQDFILSAASFAIRLGHHFASDTCSTGQLRQLGMSGSPAESSSQALERFLSAQLASLSLEVPSDDVSTPQTFFSRSSTHPIS